jgi:uncharacterized protein YegP (UPF0339 family)
MKLLSSALSFATPVDIEKLVEDITDSAMTVYTFVKNSGLLPLYASRLRYFKYEEQDLSEFLDDLGDARDIIANMEFDRINMLYSIDVIKGAETLLRAMNGLKTKSISGAKTIVKTSAKIKGIKGKIPGVLEKPVESSQEPMQDEEQLEEMVSTTGRINERLVAIKKDWPQFKESVDVLCTRLKPLLIQLNKVLGIDPEGMTKAKLGKFEVYKDSKGQFRFRLRAVNNEIIAVSEAYTNKTGCMNGIESVRINAISAIIDDQT